MAQGLLCIYHGAHLLSLYTDQLYWDELCYILGLTGMNLSTFLIVSTLGRMPGTYLLTIQGATIGSRQYETAIVVAVISGVIVFMAYLYRSRLYHWIRSVSAKDVSL